MFLDKFLNIYEVGGYLADRLIISWVVIGELDLTSYLGYVVSTVATVDHFLNIEHRDHILGQELGICTNFSDVLWCAR